MAPTAGLIREAAHDLTGAETLFERSLVLRSNGTVRATRERVVATLAGTLPALDEGPLSQMAATWCRAAVQASSGEVLESGELPNSYSDEGCAWTWPAEEAAPVARFDARLVAPMSFEQDNLWLVVEHDGTRPRFDLAEAHRPTARDGKLELVRGDGVRMARRRRRRAARAARPVRGVEDARAHYQALVGDHDARELLTRFEVAQ